VEPEAEFANAPPRQQHSMTARLQELKRAENYVNTVAPPMANEAG